MIYCCFLFPPSPHLSVITLLYAAVEMLMLDCNFAAVAEPMSGKPVLAKGGLSVATELSLGGPLLKPTSLLQDQQEIGRAHV